MHAFKIELNPVDLIIRIQYLIIKNQILDAIKT